MKVGMVKIKLVMPSLALGSRYRTFRSYNSVGFKDSVHLCLDAAHASRFLLFQIWSQ